MEVRLDENAINERQDDFESRYCGTATELFCIVMLYHLMIIFTLGIAAPWALCMRERWRTENTIIDGKQLVFEGTGGQLFWRYMGWSILTLLTLGFFGWKRAANVRDWMTARTHLI